MLNIQDVLDRRVSLFHYLADRNRYIIHAYTQTDKNVDKYLTSMGNMQTTIYDALAKGDRSNGIIEYIDNTAIPYLKAVYEKIRHTQNRV